MVPVLVDAIKASRHRGWWPAYQRRPSWGSSRAAPWPPAGVTCSNFCVDFTLGETQQAVAQAAAHVLDRDPPLPGHAVWKELGQAGLLGLALPAWLGGDGLGVLDTAVLLTEVGRRAAPVPALATLATGVLPVVRWGDREPAAGPAGRRRRRGHHPHRRGARAVGPDAGRAGHHGQARLRLGGQDRRPVRRGGALDPGAGQPRLGRHRRGRGRPVSRRGEAVADAQLGRRPRVHAAPGRGARRPPARG